VLLSETQSVIRDAVIGARGNRFRPRSQAFESAAGYPPELAAADRSLSTIVLIRGSLLVAGVVKEGSKAQMTRCLPELTSVRMRRGVTRLRSRGNEVTASANP
jgi:hypothetical protein